MGTENLEVKTLNPNHKSRLLKIIVSIETMLVIAAIHQSLSGKLLITGAVIFAFTLILPAYFLIKKDKLNINYNVFLVFLTILVLSFIWLFNGLRDEVLFTIPAIIMLSLLMCSQRFTLYLYLFICLNILAIGYLNQFNYMIHKSDEASIEVALLLIIIFTFISYVAWLISIEMKQTNKALIESKNELEDRVKQRTLELEQSLKNLTSTQEQLVNTEKMASLGRLVAGVAHEINTPVGIAITASSHLEDRTDRFSERYENQGISQKFMANYLETAKSSSELIQSNLKRAADLIQGFKEVAVDQSSDEIRKFELTEYIKEVFSSLHPQIKRSRCRVEYDFDDKIFITTTPGSIAQIITNLTMNSVIHGFDNKKDGVITVRVKQVDDKITIAFKDSGWGIKPENLTKIFEPFFTTKRGEGGSGLGMHIVYNLVTQSLNGCIECSSTLGKGTTFIITFPNISDS